jgi:arginase
MKRLLSVIGANCHQGQRKLGPRLAFNRINPLLNFNIESMTFIDNSNFNSTVGYKMLEQSCTSNLNQKRSNIVIGGDHSIALGSVAASAKKYKNTKILWIDAHPDIHIHSTSSSKNLHGMPLGILLGLDGINKPLIKPEQIIYLGIRDIDSAEEKFIQNLGITRFPMKKIIDSGIQDILKQIDKKIGKNPIHVSFDIDVMDNSLVPGTGTPVKIGLNLNELGDIEKWLKKKRNNIMTFDLVEINPLLDRNDRTLKLGARILNNIFL